MSLVVVEELGDAGADWLLLCMSSYHLWGRKVYWAVSLVTEASAW